MPTRSEAGVRYVRKNFDEAAILAVAAKLAFEADPDFSESELATIAAMQRAHPRAGESTQDLSDWLSAMDDDQIQGVINNTKGVLHEMEFVRLENEDGDAIHAALFASTNHPGTDVQFMDIDSGESWSAQLKATNDASYVQDWMDAHPEGEILVTSELADRMDLPQSGISNDVLMARAEDVVDQLVDAGPGSDLWDYFPALTTASIALVVWELWKRHRQGELRLSQFQWMAAKVSGMRAGKIALLTVAMTIPGVNVVTGAALVASLLYSAAQTVKTVSR